MNANKIIVEVIRQNKINWCNSDIHHDGEMLLRQIAVHFLSCKDCSEEFDLQGYPEMTLQDFASNYLTNSNLQDWIC